MHKICNKIWTTGRFSTDWTKSLTYGCETWTLRTKEEAMLNVFEMAALRKIAGVKLVDRIRNEIIREKLGQTRTIVHIIHERQTRWLGHILRMKDKGFQRSSCKEK